MTGGSGCASGAMRVCAVIPVYNHGVTVAAVVRCTCAVVPTVIVVDDGSTDGTAEALAGLDIERVRFPRNRGKGHALLGGYRRALELGFTHAVTLDADGQHAAEDLPAMVAACRAQPDAMVIGVRDLAGGGRARKSRLLRAHSNFWVWLETGTWVADTQSGFRVVPLARLLGLKLHTGRYDFEVETIVKLLWAGGRVVSTPVRARYGPGSTSHFRPLRDFALVALLNTRLVTMRLLLSKPACRFLAEQPAPGRGRLAQARDLLRAALDVRGTGRGKFAWSLGVGLGCSVLPVWGLQFLVALLLANLFRLNKALTVVGSYASIPAIIPGILYVSLLLGRVLVGRGLDLAVSLDGLTPEMAWRYALEYAVGATALGVALTLAGAGLAYALTAGGVGGRRETA